MDFKRKNAFILSLILLTSGLTFLFFNSTQNTIPEKTIGELIAPQGVNLFDYLEDTKKKLASLSAGARTPEEFNSFYASGTEGGKLLNNWNYSIGSSMRDIGFASEPVTLIYDGKEFPGVRLSLLPDANSALHQEIKGFLSNKGALFLSPLFDRHHYLADGMSAGARSDGKVYIKDSMGQVRDFFGKDSGGLNNRLSQSMVWMQTKSFLKMKLNTPTINFTTLLHEISHFYDKMDAVKGTLNPVHGGVNGTFGTGYKNLELTELRSWSLDAANAKVLEELSLVKSSSSAYADALKTSHAMADYALELVHNARSYLTTDDVIKAAISENEHGWTRISWGTYEESGKPPMPKYWFDLSGLKYSDAVNNINKVKALARQQIDAIQVLAEGAKNEILASASVLDFQSRNEIVNNEKQFLNNTRTTNYYDPARAEEIKRSNYSIDRTLNLKATELNSANQESIIGNAKLLLEARQESMSGVNENNQTISRDELHKNLKKEVPNHKSPSDATPTQKESSSLQKLKDSITKPIADFHKTSAGAKIGGAAGGAFLLAKTIQFIDGFSFSDNKGEFALQFAKELAGELAKMAVIGGVVAAFVAAAPVVGGVVATSLLIAGTAFAVGDILGAINDLGTHVMNERSFKQQFTGEMWAAANPQGKAVFPPVDGNGAGFTAADLVGNHAGMFENTAHSDNLNNRIENAITDGESPTSNKIKNWQKELVASELEYGKNLKQITEQQKKVKEISGNKNFSYESLLSPWPKSSDQEKIKSIAQRANVDYMSNSSNIANQKTDKTKYNEWYQSVLQTQAFESQVMLQNILNEQANYSNTSSENSRQFDYGDFDKGVSFDEENYVDSGYFDRSGESDNSGQSFNGSLQKEKPNLNSSTDNGDTSRSRYSQTVISRDNKTGQISVSIRGSDTPFQFDTPSTSPPNLPYMPIVFTGNRYVSEVPVSRR